MGRDGRRSGRRGSSAGTVRGRDPVTPRGTYSPVASTPAQRPGQLQFHTIRPLDEDAFAGTLDFRPDVISFHLGVCPDLISRAHEAGIRWVQQVMDHVQAGQALAAGSAVLIAPRWRSRRL